MADFPSCSRSQLVFNKQTQQQINTINAMSMSETPPPFLGEKQAKVHQFELLASFSKIGDNESCLQPFHTCTILIQSAFLFIVSLSLTCISKVMSLGKCRRMYCWKLWQGIKSSDLVAEWVVAIFVPNKYLRIAIHDIAKPGFSERPHS